MKTHVARWQADVAQITVTQLLDKLGLYTSDVIDNAKLESIDHIDEDGRAVGRIIRLDLLIMSAEQKE